MSPFEGHLSDEDLLRLAEGQSKEDRATDVGGDLADMRVHLASCETCRRLFQLHEQIDGKLRGLPVEESLSRGHECPPRAELVELAAGITSPEKAEALLEHCSSCDSCGPAFKAIVLDFDDATTPGEEELLRGLSTARPEWQRDFAKRMAEKRGRAPGNLRPGGQKKSRFQLYPVPNWAYALAAAILVAAVTVLVTRRGTSIRDTNALLAEAYGERRNLELRFPGARWAEPPDPNRGPEEGSLLDRPLPLQKAEEVIASKLKKQPANSVWLQAKGRADLMDGKYQSAFDSLQKAKRDSPEGPSLMIDLASAYVERAQKEKTASDYGRAFDLLSQALDKSPDDPVALFNRAIVAERIPCYARAAEDWKHYLRVETSPEWQQEARQHLSDVEKKLPPPKQPGVSERKGAEDFLRDVEESDQSGSGGLDALAERYETVAFENWLPQRYATELIGSGKEQALDRALSIMSAHSVRRHQDAWLRDLISELPSGGPSRGVSALAEAHRANIRGDYEAAIGFAEQAVTYFESDREEAGRIRAAFELIYANHLGAHGLRCYDEATALVPELLGKGYRWIEIQMRLESAACAAEISRVDESITKARDGLNEAKLYGYENLELRAIAFVAGLTEDSEESFQLIHDGLNLYWEEGGEPMRAYSLYDGMDLAADHLGLWNFDVAAIREGIAFIEQDPDLSLRGMEQYRLARAYIMVGNPVEADRNFREARGLLERSKSRDLIPDISIDLAEVYVQQKRDAEALQLLDTVEGDVKRLSHDILLGRFDSVRSRALVGLGREGEAEQSLLSAIEIAKKGLGSISDERSRIAWIQTFAPAYRSLASIRLRKDPESSFRWWEAYKGVSLRVSTEENSTPFETTADPSVPALEKWTTADPVVLSYLILEDGVALWVLDGKGLHFTSLGLSGDKLTLLAREFAADCSNVRSDRSSITAEGRELYDLLLKPAATWLEGRSRLIIETDGPLGFVPFEALVDESGRFVNESFEIQYSPGLLYNSASTHGTTVNRRSRALVVGNPLLDLAATVPSLPDAVEEAREIAAQFLNPRLLLGPDAKLPVVLRDLAEAEVFHFAGHAVENRETTGLMLAGSTEHGEEGVLTAAHLNRKMLQRSHLVVLSACSTVSGSAEGFLDNEGLAESFLVLGAPQVVASRWVVDSSATHEWMKVFYEERLAGQSSSSSARKASSALRGQQKWTHPFYWAAFGVFSSTT